MLRMGKEISTVSRSPGPSSFVFANAQTDFALLPKSPCGHSAYTCTTSAPRTFPVFLTSTVTEISPPLHELPRTSCENVV